MLYNCLTNWSYDMKNTFEPKIDTRATRSLDAKITLGIVAVEFSKGKIKLIIDPRDRDMNKQRIADMEQTVHKYIGLPITGENIKALTNELLPMAVELETLY